MRIGRISRYRGVAVTLIAAAAVASFPGTAAAQPLTSINSRSGWQRSSATLTNGQDYTVNTTSKGPDGRAGTWTVDFRRWPAIGPNGYDAATDRRIRGGCKYDFNLPYGRLLGRIGVNGPVFSIGAGGKFRATTNGILYLRINDRNRCLADNRGYIQVRVS
ncbi:MAG TPA: hypothetical protein VJT49_33840 [Amycolatopsis sp.]|uniref:hypothetical protein n=1 Tax=Amycolatopsis sp. TaxID=37632 RepID=UPI002B48590E|nr:hypothetical protein [Amycolatopsis sp.]HKS50005.1 hypothetical protein [Amycolatopsis sp.]